MLAALHTTAHHQRRRIVGSIIHLFICNSFCKHVQLCIVDTISIQNSFPCTASHVNPKFRYKLHMLSKEDYPVVKKAQICRWCVDVDGKSRGGCLRCSWSEGDRDMETAWGHGTRRATADLPSLWTHFVSYIHIVYNLGGLNKR
jgi:hypothetical protein